MRAVRSSRVRPRGLLCCPLLLPHGAFSTIQRGHDRQRESLYEKLGFGMDSEAHRIRRSLQELEEGFVLEVRKLRDPVHDAKDRARLEDLKEAYVLLRDEGFRSRYNSHYSCSNDAQLHVLMDGGQVAANYNPEHQAFHFVDHAKMRGEGDEASLGAGERPVSSYNEFQNAFRSAAGLGPESSMEVRVHDAAAATRPLNGASVSFLLHLSFEESALGCSKQLDVVKHVRCRTCQGSGTQKLKTRRACPQCLGRGSTHLPSAVYHMERQCSYCGGEGTVPPPRCIACRGRGVRLNAHVTIPVAIPAGTTSHTVFRIAGHGHDGARGGRPGELILTVICGEHKHFFRYGADLHCMLPLPLSTALLGGVVSVPTLQGYAALRVQPCVRNGQILSLAQHGVNRRTVEASSLTSVDSAESAASPAPHQPSADRGAIFYHVLVTIPAADSLTGRQRAMLEQFEGSVPPEAVGDEECREAEQLSEAARQSEESERERRLSDCAMAKQQYRHWLSPASS